GGNWGRWCSGAPGGSTSSTGRCRWPGRKIAPDPSRRSFFFAGAGPAAGSTGQEDRVIEDVTRDNEQVEVAKVGITKDAVRAAMLLDIAAIEEKLPKWRHITPADLVVLYHLAGVCGDPRSDRAGCAWPSVETLAKRAHCSERSARRALRLWELAGVIRRVTDSQGRSSNVYRAMFWAPKGAKVQPLQPGQSDRVQHS